MISAVFLVFNYIILSSFIITITYKFTITYKLVNNPRTYDKNTMYFMTAPCDLSI